MGTPNFIAPETIRDPNQCDARSDIYSVGVLGYFLLTGRQIFDGETSAELCRKHLDETPVPPSQRLGQPVQPQMESLLMRCLEKDPAARPPTAFALAQELAACATRNAWTTGQRAAWWVAHRQSISGATRPAVLAPSEIDKTVKIEFADRTP